MNWKEIPTGKTHIAFENFMTSLGPEADTVVKKLHSPKSAFSQRLTACALNDGVVPSTSHTAARKIMGENFLGIEEGMSHMRVDPTRRQLAILEKIPWSKARLEETRETHLLVAGFSLSINQISEKVSLIKIPGSNHPLLSGLPGEAFADELSETGWHLIRKTPVEGSAFKDWDGQQLLLGEDEEVPKPQVMVYAISCYYVATGKQIFEKFYVRTSGGILVGQNGPRGLNVHIYDGNRTDPSLGIASEVKF